jgi:hypothetical protein
MHRKEYQMQEAFFIETERHGWINLRRVCRFWEHDGVATAETDDGLTWEVPESTYRLLLGLVVSK